MFQKERDTAIAPLSLGSTRDLARKAGHGTRWWAKAPHILKTCDGLHCLLVALVVCSLHLVDHLLVVLQLLLLILEDCNLLHDRQSAPRAP